MSSYLIDTHCHLHDSEFYSAEQAAQFLVAAQKHKVEHIIVIGTDPHDSAVASQFAAAHSGVFWTYGIHPEYTNAHPVDAALEAELQRFCRQARDLAPASSSSTAAPISSNLPTANLAASQSIASPGLTTTMYPAMSKPVAIGEIGLDYHYEPYDRPAQIHLFETMLQLAQDLSLPVSLHIREREAFADAWPILDNFPHLTVVVHSFTGSKQELHRALSRNFYIGVNGLATYSTLPLPPLEKMLLETDAPFLTPIPFRGTINTPEYVRYVAAYLSGKMGVAEETLVEQTTNNARQLFHI